MGSIPGWEDLLEKEVATHSSILAWRMPWTEEPGGLQSMGSQRVKHDGSDSAVTRRHQVACFLLLLNFLSHHSEVHGYCLALHPHGCPGVKPILGPATSQVSISALGTGALSPSCVPKKNTPKVKSLIGDMCIKMGPQRAAALL